MLDNREVTFISKRVRILKGGKPWMAVLLGIFAVCLSAPKVYSQEYLQVARYIEVSPVPAIEESKLLMVPVTKKIPNRVNSRGQDSKFHAANISWETVPELLQSSEVMALYLKPLPSVHRDLVEQSTQQALLTVAGLAYQLLAAPLLRGVSFTLNNDYRAM